MRLRTLSGCTRVKMVAWPVKPREGWRQHSWPNMEEGFLGNPIGPSNGHDRGHLALGQGNPIAQAPGWTGQRIKMRLILQTWPVSAGAEWGWVRMGLVQVSVYRIETTDYKLFPAAKPSVTAGTETSGAQHKNQTHLPSVLSLQPDISWGRREEEIP